MTIALCIMAGAMVGISFVYVVFACVHLREKNRIECERLELAKARFEYEMMHDFIDDYEV